MLIEHIARVATIIKNGNKRAWPLNDLKGISMIWISDVKCSIKALIGLSKTIDNISLRRNIIKGNSNNISNFNIFDNNSNYTNNLIIENSKILNP